MKIAFYTLGCKVNQYETQALKEKFISLGHQIVGEQDPADVYIVNTCTVTGLADRKSRQYIRRMKKLNPKSITAVIGCYAQVKPDEIMAIEEVDIVAGNNEKNRLPEYIDNYIAQKDKLESPVCHIKSYEQLSEYEETGIITSMESRTRAYIKVQEGCNQFCTYCIIPYARGKVRSRSIENIICEAQSLIAKGFKELVLTGINTALYGMEEKTDNPYLQGTEEKKEKEIYGIERVIKSLNELPGDFRIRLGSLEPTVINASYVKRLIQYEKLCPHMHLSLQSGSNRILNLMNRHYDCKGYLDIVKVLRNFDLGYGFTTDIIVGFPGETEEDFQESIKMIEEVKFSKVHIFPYSKRKGTKAAEMPKQIPSEIKKRRIDEMTMVSEKSSQSYLESNLGTVRQVLFEEYDEKNDYITGFSDNYIKVYYKVPKGVEVNSLLNSFHDVKLLNVYKKGINVKVL